MADVYQYKPLFRTNRNIAVNFRLVMHVLGIWLLVEACSSFTEVIGGMNKMNKKQSHGK